MDHAEFLFEGQLKTIVVFSAKRIATLLSSIKWTEDDFAFPMEVVGPRARDAQCKGLLCRVK